MTSSTPGTDTGASTSCTQAITGTAPPPAAADLSITKTAPADVLPGGTVRHTLTVANHGPAAARDVQVTDALPSSLTVTCPAGTLPAGHSRTFRLTGRVSPGTPAGAVFKNCATAVSTTPDHHLANNGSCTTTTVRRPVDVAITKTGPATATRGQQITYTLTAANRGGTTSRGTLVSDVFPRELAVTRVPAGCTLAGRTLTCPLGSLAPGTARTFRVTATVLTARGGPAVANCATVYTTTAETNLANNASCVQAFVSLEEEVPVTG